MGGRASSQASSLLWIDRNVVFGKAATIWDNEANARVQILLYEGNALGRSVGHTAAVPSLPLPHWGSARAVVGCSSISGSWSTTQSQGRIHECLSPLFASKYFIEVHVCLILCS